MREGLRSSSLRKRSNEVDHGKDDDGLEMKKIHDLNRKQDLGVDLTEEKVDSCLEVTKTDGIGKSDRGIDERVVVGDGEMKGIEVDDECKRVGSQSVECGGDDGERKEVDTEKIVDCTGVIGRDADVGGEGKVGLSCAVDLGTLEGDHKGRVIEDDSDGGKEVDVKGKNLESAMVVESNEKIGGAKVLRSRIVPASGIGEDSCGSKKRKRGTDVEEEAAMTKDENKKSASGRSEEDMVQVSEIPLVLKAEVEDGFNNSGCNPIKKRKRGRPKKYLDNFEEQVFPMCNDKVESEVGDENFSRISSTTPKKKGKRGRPKKLVDHPTRVGFLKTKVQGLTQGGEDLTEQSVRSLKKKKKRGRPRKYFNSLEEKVDCHVGKKAQGISESVGHSKPKRKRGRPKRSSDLSEEQVVPANKVPFGEVEDEDENACNEPVRNQKMQRKRGRPKKVDDNAEVKIKLHDKCSMKDERKMKVSLVTAPVRKSRPNTHPRQVLEAPDDGITGKKTTSSNNEETENNSKRNFVREETAVSKSKSSVKQKRGEIAGSAKAEKNEIRKQIVDMLVSAGWRIEFKPRQGKRYNDSVYISPEGKGLWSVTKAYNTLKQQVEEGKIKAGNSNFCFTPIPEEVLSKLYKVMTKTRSDKNKKKKHKYDIGDSSDEEPFRKKSNRRDGPSSRRCALRVRHSNKGSNSKSDGVVACSGKHSVLAWMIDLGSIPLDAKVQYMKPCEANSMVEGSVTRDGIHCSCCKKVLSVAEFEKHAGSELDEPYENVCLANGKSLLQCQLDSWNKQQEMGRSGHYDVPVDGEDPNDDTCGICGDGGDLVCCDGCPSTFHHDCLNIEEIPSGEWYCVYCSCKFCNKGGEVESKRDDDCDTDLSSLVTCSLCNEKYHQACIEKEDAVCVVSRQPAVCGSKCKQIFERLQSLVGAKHEFGDGYSWTLLQRSDVNTESFPSQAQNIRSNSKLAVALSVMNECFLPTIDPRSGIEMIRHIVYSCGCNFNRLNFSSFFTMILERGDEVISTASIRIHGKGVAEMPFIGTCNAYRRQGMCRRLLSAIELALGSLDIEKLIIPAIPELIHTWTTVFGFQPLKQSVKEDMKSMNMLVFLQTDMLQKLISKEQLVTNTVDIAEENEKCCESETKRPGGGADIFDLNCVATDDLESFDEGRQVHSGSMAVNCDDGVRNQVMLEGMSNGNNVEIGSSLKENDYHINGACDLLMGASVRPDLNLVEQDGFEDSVNPDSLKDDGIKVRHDSDTNSDKLVKSTEYSCDLTKVDDLPSDKLPKPNSECASDGTYCAKVSVH